MKTVIYGGHLSRFGFTCIEAILESNYFRVDSIIIADLNRWITFYEALQKGQQKINHRKIKKSYKKNTEALKKLIADKAILIRTISNSRTETEYTFLKNYDLVLSAAFPQIFSITFLQSPKKGAVNFHPSYLPRCRGANPVYWTIASKEPFGGLSCHFMTGKIDQGPIAVQQKIDFEQQKITLQELHQKIIDCIPGLVLKLEDFFKNSQAATPQDESLATYFTEDLPKDHRVYWNTENYDQIDAKIRAGNAFTRYRKLRVLLRSPACFKKNIPFGINPELRNAKNGTIVYLDETSIWIKIENGYLQTAYLIPVSGLLWLQRVRLYPLIREYKKIRFNLSTGVVLE